MDPDWKKSSIMGHLNSKHNMVKDISISVVVTWLRKLVRAFPR